MTARRPEITDAELTAALKTLQRALRREAGVTPEAAKKALRVVEAYTRQRERPAAEKVKRPGTKPPVHQPQPHRQPLVPTRCPMCKAAGIQRVSKPASGTSIWFHCPFCRHTWKFLVDEPEAGPRR